ncbi:hypothetical protein ACQ3JU_0615 (plasmid) [Bradyrhizobium guangxiense]
MRRCVAPVGEPAASRVVDRKWSGGHRQIHPHSRNLLQGARKGQGRAVLRVRARSWPQGASVHRATGTRARRWQFRECDGVYPRRASGLRHLGAARMQELELRQGASGLPRSREQSTAVRRIPWRRRRSDGFGQGLWASALLGLHSRSAGGRSSLQRGLQRISAGGRRLLSDDHRQGTSPQRRRGLFAQGRGSPQSDGQNRDARPQGRVRRQTRERCSARRWFDREGGAGGRADGRSLSPRRDSCSSPASGRPLICGSTGSTSSPTCLVWAKTIRIISKPPFSARSRTRSRCSAKTKACARSRTCCSTC